MGKSKMQTLFIENEKAGARISCHLSMILCWTSPPG
ncbi:hypothetical protein B14911_26095 [Bacillus sp. NRRL B-14911]|nr:hypothetical protein B14911_26095 [Bacillus sp. NRRL B-14911]